MILKIKLLVSLSLLSVHVSDNIASSAFLAISTALVVEA